MYQREKERQRELFPLLETDEERKRKLNDKLMTNKKRNSFKIKDKTISDEDE